MLATRLMTKTATITRVTQDGAADGYGDPTEQTTTASAACWLHQTQRSEDTRDANRQAQTWDAYFAPGTVLDGSDRVTVDGIAYEVEGPPWKADNPRTGAEEFVAATLRRVV